MTPTPTFDISIMLRGRSISRPSGRSSLKGRFLDGKWCCDCDPRLQARIFQTKNGGQNHGRWFYKCPLPEPARCKFFLWEDEAKSREMGAVFHQPPPDPHSAPQTPVKNISKVFVTPPASVERNIPRFLTPEISLPKTPSKSSSSFPSLAEDRQSTDPAFQVTITEDQESENEEFFDLPANDDEEVGGAASQIPGNPMPPPETPCKALQKDIFYTPRKRRHYEAADSSTSNCPTPSTQRIIQDDDVFSAPSSTKVGTPNLFSNFFPSPAETPTLRRFKDFPCQDSDLATQVLQLLDRKSVPLSSELKDEIRGMGDKNNNFTRGVIKGRDVLRTLLEKKSKEIVDLLGALAELQSERETHLVLIRQLRREHVEE